MPTANVRAFATRLREAQARRYAHARDTAQQDILRRWGTAVLTRRDFTPDQMGRTVAALARTGLPIGTAEQVVTQALTDAKAAFQAALIRHGSEAASDSENTDTGRIQRV